MERIEITRSDFEAHFGVFPHPDAMGMKIVCTSADGLPVAAAEYVFIDDPMSGQRIMEIAELERMYGD